MTDWVAQAVRKIEADFNRSSDTHLIPLPMPGVPEIQLYFKDESTHPTGSLKHRLARSLFLYGLCNGWIREGSTIIEASSGSTAVSEAYFSRLLGLPFIAVMPKSTSQEKIRAIEFYGGRSHLVDDPATIYDESKRLAQELNGHYMDQFTYAERATDWRGNNNIADTIFTQMAYEPNPVPDWIICGAGTGGTSATFGRYVRYQKLATKVCVVDPENSVFYDSFHTGSVDCRCEGGSGVEGIGRPRVEPSFIPTVIDEVIRVPNVASYAAIHFLEEVLGRRCGGSTGTNFYGVCELVSQMRKQGRSGSIVTLICDDGNRYQDSYYKPEWLQANGFDISPWVERYRRFFNEGQW
ncbi:MULTISPECIES: PLP-dependent cysteine synthase family protein [Chromobacterium]|uniref:L-cysteine desulfhydrase Cds1 n=1 Tax=Chromobacterium aquaticum TaxID=467180 RepID=A0ABV8ZYS3_9NEIS|nr:MULTISPECIES: PLP-dependent cysteine synthase family protein [Chromobacterium]KMN37078.1 cysteine synthase [Chromobacterium sp. LK1]MCD5362383.1 PLP-dependent cysteine synthase family protein [Chromobacterium aquaticum]